MAQVPNCYTTLELPLTVGAKLTEYACIMPAKNEANTITQAVEGFQEAVGKHGKFQIIVVDDGSTDDTAQIAASCGAHVVQTLDNDSGLAAAFRRGNQEALTTSADYFIHVDSDLQYSPNDLDSLISAARYDRLVIGDRLWKKPASMSSVRYSINQELSSWIGDICARPILDSQSGYRVYHRNLSKALPIRARQTYTQEQIIRAAHSNIELQFVPIEFNGRVGTTSRLVKDPFIFLSRIFDDVAQVVNELEIKVELHTPTPTRTTRPSYTPTRLS